ncbi:3-oxoacyl-[acyl-carrier protein] reductase [Labilithrix luteola]|uniref:3-oxoacyl-[acyl-carrier protein] reductase n=1 Tax=Labilithrix luteola TaxID=1391654 RepID=A0A0K1PNU7_9BACT|nr:glucose 1-dehydrogenase [Labilithrix luteola]AKU94779.1 3-oxoacyl-[acyl-carrier protein] reductase [Labilithrix luteola]
MGKLTGKVAVVTGASKGIGAAIARALGAEGASVVASYGGDREGAERTAVAIEASGGKALAVQADMSKEADVKRLFATIRETFGRLDVLVNNAGIYRFGPIEGVTVDEYRAQFDTNVLGPMLAIREALPLFGPEGGSIINVGTGATESTPPNSVVYIASKMALNGVTGVLARELGPRKIRVNSLNPGVTATEGFKNMADRDFTNSLVATTPLGRIGKPEDLGGTAVFLASDDSAWLTGEILVVSGGLR